MGKVKSLQILKVLAGIIVCVCVAVCFFAVSQNKVASPTDSADVIADGAISVAETQAKGGAPGKSDTRDAIHFLNTNVIGNTGTNENCILLESNGQLALIDTGHDGRGQFIYDYARRIRGLADGANITFVFILITHNHSDHIGGFDSLFNTGHVKATNVFWRDDSDSTKVNGVIKKWFDKGGYITYSVRSTSLDTGHELYLGDMIVRLLNIDQAEYNKPDNYNNWSIAQDIRVNGSSFGALLMADILADRTVWPGLTEEEKIAADFNGSTFDLLQVNHHGLEAHSDYFKARIKARNAVYTNAIAFDKHPVSNSIDDIKDMYPISGGSHYGVRDTGGLLCEIGTGSTATYSEIGEWVNGKNKASNYRAYEGDGIPIDSGNYKYFLPLTGGGKYYLAADTTISDLTLGRANGSNMYRYFTGTFDGRDKTINYTSSKYASESSFNNTNLVGRLDPNPSGSGENYYGVISCLMNGATVKNFNFNLRDSIYLKDSSSNGWYQLGLGLITGQMWGSSVIDNVKVDMTGQYGNLYLYAKRTANESGGTATVGAFAGMAGPGCRITNSELVMGSHAIGAKGERHNGSNNISEYGRSSAGGFLGEAIGDVRLADCKIIGTTGSYIVADGWGGSTGGNNPAAGGLVGRAMGSHSVSASVSALQSGWLTVDGLIFDFKGEAWTSSTQTVGKGQNTVAEGARPAGLLVGVISNNLHVLNAYRANYEAGYAAAGGTWREPMTGRPTGNATSAAKLEASTSWSTNAVWLGRYNASKMTFGSGNYIYEPTLQFGSNTNDRNGTRTLTDITNGTIGITYTASGTDTFLYKTYNIAHITSTSKNSDLITTHNGTFPKGTATPDGYVIIRKTGRYLTDYSKTYDGEGFAHNFNTEGGIAYAGGGWDGVNWKYFGGTTLYESGGSTYNHSSMTTFKSKNANAGTYTFTLQKGTSDFAIIEDGSAPRYLLLYSDTGSFNGRLYKQFKVTVNKANVPALSVTAQNVVFEQGEPTRSVNPAHPQSGATVWEYSTNKSTVSTWANLDKNVGTRYVRARFNATSNYNAYTSDWTEFKITKKLYSGITHAGFSATYGSPQTLSGLTLNENYWWDNSATALTAGKKSFKAWYNADPANFENFTLNIEVNIAKGTYSNKTHDAVNATYGVQNTLANVTLNANYRWKNSVTALVAGNHSFDAFYNADSANMNDFSLNIPVNVAKGTYSNITHDALSATYGVQNTLADLTLDANYSWDNSATALVAGNHSFKAFYNADSANMNDFILNISVDVAKGDYANITHAGFNATYGIQETLADLSLDANYRWDLSATALTAGEKSFKAWYNTDSANMNDFPLNITVDVAKGTYDDITHTALNTTYGAHKNLANLILNANYRWATPAIVLVAGNHSFDALYNADAENMNDFALNITVNVEKGDYIDITHANFSVTYGIQETLADLNLDENYRWDDGGISLVLGRHEFKAWYNADSANMNDFELNIAVNVAGGYYTGITHTPLSIKYTERNTLTDVLGLNENFSWVNDKLKVSPSVKFYAAIYNADPDNMSDFLLYIRVDVTKGTFGTVTHKKLSTEFKAGDALSSVDGLSWGFSWKDDTVQIEAGEHSYIAVYNPDPTNFEALDVLVTITATEIVAEELGTNASRPDSKNENVLGGAELPAPAETVARNPLRNLWIIAPAALALVILSLTLAKKRKHRMNNRQNSKVRF